MLWAWLVSFPSPRVFLLLTQTAASCCVSCLFLGLMQVFEVAHTSQCRGINCAGVRWMRFPKQRSQSLRPTRSALAEEDSLPLLALPVRW